MLPADFQQQYKKAFFETYGPSRRMTKHALAIVDPALGDEWWRYFFQHVSLQDTNWLQFLYIFSLNKTLQTIEWSTRPKWVMEERLYGLACAYLTPTKKTFFLRVMASNDLTNIKSISFPQTCKSNALHVHHYQNFFYDF